MNGNLLHAQGCSCNGDLMNAAATRGYTSNQVRIGAHLLYHSLACDSAELLL